MTLYRRKNEKNKFGRNTWSMQIFNFVGYIFGYILWLCYYITENYGVSIILFTLIIRLLMFPLSVKQQKSMSKTSRLSGKQKELDQKYANDKQKLNEEKAKLYEKEGVNPAGGCLTSIVPLLLMLGVYYAVLNPLTNTLHFDPNSVSQATGLLSKIPGIGASFTGQYGEIQIVENFGFLKDYLTQIFSAADMEKLNMFSHGFDFLGVNLLGTPQSSSFSGGLWIIPILCFVSSLGTSIFSQKITGANQVAQQQGCMKWMLYLMPLVSAWFAYIVPAAVGFYWIISNIVMFAQTAVINLFYNANLMTAKEEAARIALRDIEEKKVSRILVHSPSLPENTKPKKKPSGKRKKK